ncbi:MAG: tRNA (adenosine(37)-N6)-threonylcarbamoyltransferase complex dimerization subunit type 1 TsaB [Burkholderiales bacterium]|nr:tRNA (adenosine(37)-N6)-threonylcarbamoyltransferase complex dimerization subunit type 1 TsaB [Burkholderiales bacterium]
MTKPHTVPLLAFDTSTEMLAVAAAGPRGDCAWNGPGGAAASAHLVPQIGVVLERAGLALTDLMAIAFGRGPGAFTGLRTSCAVAQGLGFGLARPLLPLDSLLVVAEDAIEALPRTAASRTVAVAMDARMDEIYGGVYERGPSGWRVLRAPALHALADWNAVLEQEARSLHALAGSALGAFGARLHRPAGVPAQPVETDRAAALLRLARQAFEAGEGIDAAQALPLYLRDKVALTTAERAAAKLAAARAGDRGAAA